MGRRHSRQSLTEHSTHSTNAVFLKMLPTTGTYAAHRDTSRNVLDTSRRTRGVRWVRGDESRHQARDCRKGAVRCGVPVCGSELKRWIDRIPSEQPHDHTTQPRTVSGERRSREEESLSPRPAWLCDRRRKGYEQVARQGVVQLPRDSHGALRLVLHVGRRAQEVERALVGSQGARIA